MRFLQSNQKRPRLNWTEIFRPCSTVRAETFLTCWNNKSMSHIGHRRNLYNLTFWFKAFFRIQR